MIVFNDFFFKLLPNFYKVNDTLKDLQGKGLLERYLTIFGDELDDEIIPQADDYIDRVINPLNADKKFLNDIAFTVNNPPDIFNNIDQYRKLLSFILSVYKIRGTIKSYELFFAILGFDIDIEEIFTDDLTYDFTINYDDNLLWDTHCETCSGYKLIFINRNDDCTIPIFNNVNQGTLDILKKVIEFNEPINALLLDLLQGKRICEEVPVCIREEIVLSTTNFTTYDEILYDNLEEYDNKIETSVTHIFNECHNLQQQQGISVWAIQSDFEIS